jgi:predicted O-methyltransferase YrrM
VELWQMPQDIVRLQAVVHQARPRWIIDTGTKFGGSAIFFASLLAMQGEQGGGVLTVDLNLRTDARAVFATHPLGSRVRAALEGDAADPAIIATFAEQIAADPGPVLVFLDDDHNAEHVQRELQGYAQLIQPDGWLIVADTITPSWPARRSGRQRRNIPMWRNRTRARPLRGSWPATQRSSVLNRPFPTGRGISPTGFCAVAGLGKWPELSRCSSSGRHTHRRCCCCPER